MLNEMLFGKNLTEQGKMADCWQIQLNYQNKYLTMSLKDPLKARSKIQNLTSSASQKSL
jgi:hypothetical protein